MSLQQFKDGLASSCFGMTVAEAHEQGICIDCKKPPTFYSDAGRAEYKITGLCEPCFDGITKPPIPGKQKGRLI